MPYLVAAVVLVGAVASLNLLLTVGVIRRLREHSERLAQQPAGGSGPPVELMRAVGQRPDAFSAATVDGQEVTLTSLVPPAIVGFFSPRCAPCDQLAPRFAAAAARLPGGPAQALAVVSAGSQDDVADRVAQLQPVARVVVEAPGGPVSQAFSVLGWPALCQLDADGTIVTTDSEQVVAAAAAAAA